MQKFTLAVLATAALAVGCANDPATNVPAETAAEVATDAVADTGSSAETIFIEDGVAIRGADPVAYFTQGEYVPGTAEFTHEYSGATWQFASAENRDTFAADPDAYAPEYGGFCAWAVSQGQTASIDPTAWKIVDGKLYLNYSDGIQKRWEKDIPGNIAKADENWPDVLSN